MSGGEGPNNEFKPPEYTQDAWKGGVDALTALANRPYVPYSGMTVAPMNDRQMTGGEMLTDKAMFGDPQTNAARTSLMNISMGGAKNPFMDNAYTEQMINDTAGNMRDAYLGGSAMNMDALAARQGAFGGSGHTSAMQSGAANLAKQVGQMGTQTRQSEIGRKAGLWNQDRQDIMQASGMALPFAQHDLTEIGAMMGFGDKERGYMGELLGEGVNEFNRQQNHPLQNLDMLFKGLGHASTGYGQGFGPQQSGAMNMAGGAMGLLPLLFGGGN
jgi:hypothetical protein